jgi:hypothetical protein
MSAEVKFIPMCFLGMFIQKLLELIPPLFVARLFDGAFKIAVDVLSVTHNRISIGPTADSMQTVQSLTTPEIVAKEGLEPSRPRATAFKTAASASSATRP